MTTRVFSLDFQACIRHVSAMRASLEFHVLPYSASYVVHLFSHISSASSQISFFSSVSRGIFFLGSKLIEFKVAVELMF